jgi:hypothetical protein
MLVLLLSATLALVATKVKANQAFDGDDDEDSPPPFVAVVPTSIMGEFGAFPFLGLPEETTTTTTTTTPAPFGRPHFL